MKLFDFRNRQNRKIKIDDLTCEYKEYILNLAKNDPWYPSFHIAPKHGLLNDPNGLIEIDGVYHIFHQWYPAGPVHGLKYWYHYTTTDFINYNDMGIGMYPEYDFDKDGCYTGMAIKEKNGNISVYYTGVHGEEIEPCIAKADLINGEIVNRRNICSYDKNISTLNIRDPFVYYSNDEKVILLGFENKNNKGQIGIFKEYNDTVKYKGILKMKDMDFGYMLECPNYFETDKNGVIIFSPQGIKSPNKYDFRNVFSVVYSVGEKIDLKSNEFNSNEFYEIDKGFDFYAPQIFKDEKGREILIGWLGNSKCIYPSDKKQWAHMLTIPRQITIENDRIVQKPIDELLNLRDKEIIINDELDLKSKSFEVVFEGTENFGIVIENNKNENIKFLSDSNDYILDRSKMTYLYNEEYGNVRYAKRLEKFKHSIRMFFDNSAIEIFCDNGKTVFTGRVYIDDISKIKVKNTKAILYYMKRININN